MRPEVFVILIVLLPFVWLYDKVGWTGLVAVVFGIPVLIWLVIQKWKERRRVRREAERRTAAAAANAAAAARKAEAAAKTVDILDAQEEALSQRERNRIHTLEIPIDGEDRARVVIDWYAQMEEIAQAWRRGDYDFARTWLQKLSYTLGTIESGQAPAWVHERFKSLVAEFTQDDPLYKNIMDRVTPAVTISPGVLQSDLMKTLPDVSPEHFRYVLYYAEYRGDIRREKKGRSYAIFPASTEAERAVTARATRVARRLAEESLDYDPPMDEYRRLGILLDEAIHDHDYKAALEAAKQRAAMSLEIIPWQIRFGTEGIRTERGWMGGALIVGVGSEYDYLTGKAFDIGIVSAEDAIHYCDEAINVAEAKAVAIQSYLSTMVKNPVSLHMELCADIIRDKCQEAVAKDVPCDILQWTDKKAAIAATAERYASIKRLVSDAPGCIQSDFRKKYPGITSHDLYYAALRGDIRREKKGRSYALFAATSD